MTYLQRTSRWIEIGCLGWRLFYYRPTGSLGLWRGHTLIRVLRKGTEGDIT